MSDEIKQAITNIENAAFWCGQSDDDSRVAKRLSDDVKEARAALGALIEALEAKLLEAEGKLATANGLLLEVVSDLDPSAEYFAPRCMAVRIFEHLGMRPTTGDTER